MPMLPFSRDEFAKLPRRLVTLLHERSGAPFKNDRCDSERLRKLMSEPAVHEVIEDSIKCPNVGL